MGVSSQKCKINFKVLISSIIFQMCDVIAALKLSTENEEGSRFRTSSPTAETSGMATRNVMVKIYVNNCSSDSANYNLA